MRRLNPSDAAISRKDKEGVQLEGPVPEQEGPVSASEVEGCLLQAITDRGSGDAAADIDSDAAVRAGVHSAAPARPDSDARPLEDLSKSDAVRESSPGAMDEVRDAGTGSELEIALNISSEDASSAVQPRSSQQQILKLPSPISRPVLHPPNAGKDSAATEDGSGRSDAQHAAMRRITLRTIRRHSQSAPPEWQDALPQEAEQTSYCARLRHHLRIVADEPQVCKRTGVHFTRVSNQFCGRGGTFCEAAYQQYSGRMYMRWGILAGAMTVFIILLVWSLDLIQSRGIDHDSAYKYTRFILALLSAAFMLPIVVVPKVVMFKSGRWKWLLSCAIACIAWAGMYANVYRNARHFRLYSDNIDLMVDNVTTYENDKRFIDVAPMANKYTAARNMRDTLGQWMEEHKLLLNRVWPSFTFIACMIIKLDMAQLLCLSLTINGACFAFTLESAETGMTHGMAVDILLMIFVALFLLCVAWILDRSNRMSYLLLWESELDHGNLNVLLKAAELARIDDADSADDSSDHKQMFISYKHEDGEVADQVVNLLEARGWSVWIDKKGISAGVDWRNAIADGIKASVCMLFLVTPKSVRSKYCKEEVYYASCCKIPIFPLVIADPGDALIGGMKLILSRIQWTFATQPGQLDETLPALLNSIDNVACKDAPSSNSIPAPDSEPLDIGSGSVASNDSRRSMRSNKSNTSSRLLQEFSSRRRASIVEPEDGEARKHIVFVTFPDASREYWKEVQTGLQNWGFTVHLQSRRTGDVDMVDADAHSISLSGTVILALYGQHDSSMEEAIHFAYEADIPILPVCCEAGGDVTLSGAMEMMILGKNYTDITLCSSENAALVLAIRMMKNILHAKRKGANHRDSVTCLSQGAPEILSELSDGGLVGTFGSSQTVPLKRSQRVFQKAVSQVELDVHTACGRGEFVRTSGRKRSSTVGD